ncbi:uncharacterized protein PHALS_14225 [Plasmopara halstedii]|uniref:Uncharacterized protein n=1 Tax=Plasmopara halstedii TaxID=4781 RepID=A0A0N7L6D2_PLAHL|nr:uncharacterized protein PHALS_14225 [Plasmopara halstedii]CEG43947.1 hypothetical protein PHALS_14225 [Plasmopara halstedii]|eukprot:XP_024580316.1 hypothetical protein PHALS_14225 [Plasmopara halstedii]
MTYEACVASRRWEAKFGDIAAEYSDPQKAASNHPWVLGARSRQCEPMSDNSLARFTA